jgi:putative phosphoribosyl transferase
VNVDVSVIPLFRDRHAAGLALAEVLKQALTTGFSHAHTRSGDCSGLAEVLRQTLTTSVSHAHSTSGHCSEVVVLGMARGGVEVAAPIAMALEAPLDTFIGRKLGVPGLEEVAFGAIAEGGGAPVLDDVHSFIGLPRAVMRSVLARELGEVARRVMNYRDGMSLPPLNGRTVIVVDDGLASGATLRAAGIALRRLKPARLIAAVPVASVAGKQDVMTTFDAVVTLATPEPFGTVSDWYDEYTPVGDAAVRAMLGRAPRVDVGDTAPVTGSDAGRAVRRAAVTNSVSDGERIVAIPTGETGATTTIAGDLGDVRNAKHPRGLVIFAHGGGSSRASYRNRYLAARIRLAGWATLRVDLLGPSESEADAQGAVRFDIALITRRLLAATKWCVDTRAPGFERIVLFGASTGAAAAMNVAAELPARVAAVMARAGRIDLAREALGRVRVPALLVVGSVDFETLQRNLNGASHLGGSVTLQTVPGAGHTFEEPGALGCVGEQAVAFLARLHRRERILRWWSALRKIGKVQHASAFSRESFFGTTRSD